jgi:hypothetical protein
VAPLDSSSIGQLKYEGFSKKDAVYAADAVSDSNPPLTPCNLLTAFIDRLRINWFSGGTAGTLTISGFSI